MFDVSNYSTNSKHYGDSNKLVIRKMKGKTGGVELAEFLGLKKKMHLLSVDDNSQHKTTKGENRSVAAKISHIEYKCIVE